MASTTATAMPCSTPTSATVSSVISGQRELDQVEAGDGPQVTRLKSRPATKIRMAARVASGTSLRIPARG